jgi:myo-inositol-1(or 4)-monophosphatase
MHPMVNMALRAARDAGEFIVRAGDRLDLVSVDRKGVNDFVTEVDRQAEDRIVQQLHKAYPDHAITAEESGAAFSARNDCEFEWLIDPLDGTTNFIHGIPHYAVSIACLHRGRLEHAVIVDPLRREEFTASRGSGAQLNGRRIRVSSRAGLDEALLGTGIPFRAHQHGQLDAYTATLKELAGQCAGIRRAGAASLDLAYVAAGRLDGFWEIGLSAWDIAAGALLILEAGGLVCDIDGGHDYLASGHVVAANPKCLKPVLQVVRPKLGALQRGAGG